MKLTALFKKTKGSTIASQSNEGPVFTNGDEPEMDIFTKNKRTFKDVVAPEHIDFSESPKHFSNGKYFGKNLYVGLLPNQVGFASFLYSLYNHGNIDVSVFVKPVDPETAKSELSKLKTNLEVEMLSSGGSSNRYDDMQVKVAEAQRLRAEVRDGVNKLYDCSIIATCYDDDLRSLNNGVDRLKGIMGQSDIGIKNAIHVQEETFRSNKPFNQNHLNEYHTFDKRSLACTFPFTTNNINHEDGTMIGLNGDNGLPVFYNNFSKTLDNYNIFVFAKSGAGKSTLIKSLSARTATLDNVQNFAIDPEREYANIAVTLGGVNITIRPDTKTIINPFEITPAREENEFGGIIEKLNINEKINSVTNIIMAMFQGISGNPYYDDMARSIIKNDVRQEYTRVELNENVDSLYEHQETSIEKNHIIGGRQRKAMPTLSSWYKAVEESAAKNTNSDKTPYYNFILEIMADYTKYKNGSFTCFDGQSTVVINKDIPFVNFDIKDLNETTERPLAQFILTDYIWEQVIKRNYKTGHKIRCIIDEAWMMVGYKEALSFLKTMSKRARKYNASLVCITQQFQDFYSEETKPIIKNSDTKFFLKPEPTDYDDIKTIFKLTDGEIQYLRGISRGKSLMKANNVAVKLINEIPEHELLFIETNQNAMGGRSIT